MEYNSSNAKDIRRAQKAAKQAEVAAAAVVTNIMSTAEGRRWVWDELSACHIYVTSIHDNALRMAFLEGERNTGLRLLTQVITHCPEQYTQAMREANERSISNTVRDASSEPSTDDTSTDEPITE